MGPNLSIKMRISIGNNRFANVEGLVHADSVIRGRYYFFWLPTDYADLHRWLRCRMLSVEFCGIRGRFICSR